MSPLPHYIAIMSRFIAAVPGNPDRWLLVYADGRTGFHPIFQKLQDKRAILLGAVGIFGIGLPTSGYLHVREAEHVEAADDR